MRKAPIILCAVLLLFSLCLSSCASAGKPVSGSERDDASQSTAPSPDGGQTAEPTEEPSAEPTAEPDAQSSAVEPTQSPEEPTDPEAPGSLSSALPETCPADVAVILYNEPFKNGIPQATVVWNEGEFDRLYLVPRAAGTTVRAYPVSSDEEGELTVAPEPAFATTAEEGCVISASLDRPEGFPAWYVEAELPNGKKDGMMLWYNGRYGTPQYEFLEIRGRDTVLGEPMDPGLLEELYALCGEKNFWDFWSAAEDAGVTSWTEAARCFAETLEYGDSASFILTDGGEFFDGSCTFRIARFHTAYFAEEPTLEGRVRAQYDKYLEVGNADGILGPDRGGEGVELVYQLTGVSVFNALLAAKEVEVLVNGESVGTCALSQDHFCTLIPLELPEIAADRPITVEVRVTEVYFGTVQDALIEARAGIGGNISGAI